MALDATLGIPNELPKELKDALQPRRNFAPEMDVQAPTHTPEPHLYEKHGLAPGKVNTDYSPQTATRNRSSNNIDSAPTIIHRNANPPHINTTPPLGQRQGGYSQGVATGLFLRYFFEAVSEHRYSRKKMLNPRHEELVKKTSEEKGIGVIRGILEKHRKDLSHVEEWITADIKERAWNPQAYKGAKTLEEAIDVASKEVHAPMRTAFQDKEHIFDEIATVFKKLGSEEPINRAKGIVNDIYSKLYRTVAKSVIDPNSSLTLDSLSAEKIASQELLISRSGRADMQSLVRDDVAKKLRGGFYDYGMGSYSLGLTTLYASKVVVDMKRLFSEVVAYELDKKPEDVTTSDIWKSNNGVVRETWGNWAKRNILRVATDGIFFGRLLKPEMDFGKFGLVSKGCLVMQDLWLRRLTTFEKLSTFVENVIKPEDGLGKPITSESLVDLFQSYTVHNRPDISFQSVVGNNASEEVRWDYARQIFDRMAELMNQSYSYKHAVRYDENFQPLAQKSFTLPAFIFMLGNDMIDPNNPNFTMARIEIASEYGVQAMKQAHKEFTAAQHLPEAEQLPIFNKVMAQFPEAHVQWQSREERLETAKSRKSAKELAPLRPEETERPAIDNVALENAHHAKLEARQVSASL